MTHELKPCPFCGVPPKQHNFTGGDCQYICDNSECRVAVYTMPSPSVQMAKDVWNTRAEAQPSADVVTLEIERWLKKHRLVGGPAQEKGMIKHQGHNSAIRILLEDLPTLTSSLFTQPTSAGRADMLYIVRDCLKSDFTVEEIKKAPEPSADVVERVARFQEALEDIAASHVPDQPAESAAEPEVFVRMWVGRLRGIATEALKQQPQESAE